MKNSARYFLILRGKFLYGAENMPMMLEVLLLLSWFKRNAENRLGIR